MPEGADSMGNYQPTAQILEAAMQSNDEVQKQALTSLFDGSATPGSGAHAHSRGLK